MESFDPSVRPWIILSFVLFSIAMVGGLAWSTWKNFTTDAAEEAQRKIAGRYAPRADGQIIIRDDLGAEGKIFGLAIVGFVLLVGGWGLGEAQDTVEVVALLFANIFFRSIFVLPGLALAFYFRQAVIDKAHNRVTISQGVGFPLKQSTQRLDRYNAVTIDTSESGHDVCLANGAETLKIKSFAATEGTESRAFTKMLAEHLGYMYDRHMYDRRPA
jgi:hypothetical protein